MLLCYIDESGTSYEKMNNFYKDGPYIIWGSLLVSEKKYFHLERSFYDLFRKYLKIKDWRKIEIHASDVWNRNGYFSCLTLNEIKIYFNELLQLITKLRIPCLFSLQLKNIYTSKSTQEKDILIPLHSFFSQLEHITSELDQNAILIADESYRKDIIQKLLYERTRWRYNPGAREQGFQKYRFYFENRSFFILDQIHYVDSKTSLFTLIIDHLCFVVMRCLTYSYLIRSPQDNISADKSKVPVEGDVFSFFMNKCSYLTFFNKNIKDTIDLDINSYIDEHNYFNEDIHSLFDKDFVLNKIKN